MATSIKDRINAIDVIQTYSGNNPYILMLKKDILKQDDSALNDFAVEYVNKNHNFQPKIINKTIKIADWYAEKKKKDWGLEFLPEKLSIKVLLGETSTTYHCYIKYRKNMEPKQCFLPKKGVLTNFLVDDYNDIQVDFERYDKLSMSKDINRRMKNHQKDAVRFLLSRKKCILADDMGLGKTVSLAVAAIEGNFDSVLIICPASIKTNWKKELMWYVPERDISIVEGIQGKNKSELELMLGYGVGKSGKKVSELQEEVKERGKWQDNRFVIVNFDILDEFYQIPVTHSKENIQKAYENSPMLQYIKNKKSLIIIDEAHRLSNSTSIRYKVIRDLIKRGEPYSIYAATGTPITNNPRNLYCVLQFLNDPITDDYNYYMERYCDAKKFPKNAEEKEKRNIISDNFVKSKGKPSWWALTDDEKEELNKIIEKNVKMITVSNGSSNLDELKERISHMYLRRTKEDFNDIVEKTIHEVFYDLSHTQQCVYDKLWEEYEEAKLNEYPEKELNKELLEGGLYRKYLSNQMVPNTISMTDDFIKNNEKVVIACCYDEELYTLREYFGKKCVIYNGKMSLKEKDEAVRKFMNDNDTKIFIGNINAAGVGITLTSATKLIFNNISFVPGDNQQMCDRIHRLNQTKPVDIYYQIFRGTQYEKMWNIVLKKELIINQVIKKENEK